MNHALNFARSTRWIASLLSLDTASISLAQDPQETHGPDSVIADFEAASYKGWNVQGEAFGRAPASGTLDRQNPVSGYRGKGLINTTFCGGDAAVGTATSGDFVIQRKHIAFLIGGGADEDTVGVELLVGCKAVRRKAGIDSEELEWTSWDVSELLGQKARLRI